MPLNRSNLVPNSISLKSMAFLFSTLCTTAFAYGDDVAQDRITRFSLPESGDIVGEMRSVQARHEDTLIDIAKHYGLGYEAMRAANPGVDAWLPGEGTSVALPNMHLLPNTIREGIIVNVAEMRLYYFPLAKENMPEEVEIFAISIGRGDWNTPITETKVVSKIEDPVWFPPASIRAEHAAKGKTLPLRVAAGPDNPLGKYVIQLDIPGYFIHGTDRTFGIGMQVTHGCMRMYPQDIERLTFTVPNGTPVRIINQRFKAGWKNQKLYLEVHPPLDSKSDSPANQELKEELLAQEMTQAIINATKGPNEYQIDWDSVALTREEARGVPILVGKKLDRRQAANNH